PFAASPGVTVSGGTSAFAISGRSYIVIDGFTITSTSDYAISVSSSSNITISNNSISGVGHRINGQTAGGVRLTGTTSSLITHNRSDNNADHGFMISSGSTNNMVSFNEASLNAEGWQRNANGIGVIDTGSTGNIGIYDSAPASTTVDYNLVNLTTSGNMYIWNNNSYSSPTALFNATGQEQHGILADPKWVSTTTPDFHLLEGSKAIDSANSGS